MSFRKSERGYALVIVLLVIVFIMTVSAVFMRGSISNAKQEKVVDNNNLAVVAAEMGTDYYYHLISNQERVSHQKALSTAKTALNNYLICLQQVPKTIDCELSPSIEEIRDTYFNDMSKLETASFNKNKEIKNVSTENLHEYFLENGSLQVNKINHDRLEVTFNIVGLSPSSERKLASQIAFDIPSFIVESNGPSPNYGEVSTSSDEVFKEFKKKFKQVDPNTVCKEKNGKCENPGNFYSEGLARTNNPNNQTVSLTWAHNGILDPHNNMNGFNFTIITRSILLSNNANNFNGKLVLLGEDNHKGNMNGFSINGSSKNSKVCINIDGFRKEDIEKINIKKEADKKIFLYYSSKETPKWPSDVQESQKRTGSIFNFVNECVGSNLLPTETADQSTDGKYSIIEEPVKMEIDVSY